jgi:hypothetical protein
MTDIPINVTCPSCNGSGTFMSLEVPCLWCGGSRKVNHDRAAQYANQTYMLAGAGYYDGTHNLSDCWKMEAKAEAIYSRIGRTPPWRREHPTPTGAA